jgi:alkanesulfonate monooxygenase SsuD/methylene tetrahydromethanopterin reductase-like flavin-dependent oxidoreductase (luciferase family)
VSNAAEYVGVYRLALRQARPFGEFVNNRFGILVTALCCETDEDAIDLRRRALNSLASNWRRFISRGLRGAPSNIRTFRQVDRAEYGESGERLPCRLGPALMCGPTTCLKMLEGLADAGIDEVMLLCSSMKRHTMLLCAPSG